MPPPVPACTPPMTWHTTDVRHDLDPGLPDVDCRHWIPYLTAEELGLDGSKLRLDFVTGELVDARLPGSGDGS